MRLRMRVAVSLILIIVFGEMAARLYLGSEWYRYQDCGFYPFGVGDLLPNRNYIDVGKKDIPFFIHTNNIGTRNLSNMLLKKNKDLFRIAALGDSFTFGVVVNTQDTWPAQLEYLLTTQYALQAEVLNLGIVGFTIEDEYYLLEEKVIPSQPDLVLIQFYSNDIMDFAPAMRAIFRRIVLKGPSWLIQVKYYIKHGLKKSAILSLLLHYRYRYLSAKAFRQITARGSGGLERETLPPTIAKKYQADYLNYLNKTLDLAAAHQLPIAFIFFPHYTEIRGDQAVYAEDRALIQAVLKKRGIPYLDLLPALRQAGNEMDLYLLPQELHMSRFGYLVAARQIAQFLKENYGDFFKKWKKN